uniref:Uncharacterized protein n=1 Tax=Terrapene triunguis TaxID=2587831 RepID=A0A674K4G9_9SAUR
MAAALQGLLVPHLLPERCYDELFLRFNLLHGECLLPGAVFRSALPAALPSGPPARGHPPASHQRARHRHQQGKGPVPSSGRRLPPGPGAGTGWLRGAGYGAGACPL